MKKSMIVIAAVLMSASLLAAGLPTGGGPSGGGGNRGAGSSFAGSRSTQNYSNSFNRTPSMSNPNLYKASSTPRPSLGPSTRTFTATNVTPRPSRGNERLNANQVNNFVKLPGDAGATSRSLESLSTSGRYSGKKVISGGGAVVEGKVREGALPAGKVWAGGSRTFDENTGRRDLGPEGKGFRGNTNFPTKGFSSFNRRPVDVNRVHDVRRNVGNWDVFSRRWDEGHRRSWRLHDDDWRWRWRWATWPGICGWYGGWTTPFYYDYGTNVVYRDDTVYVNGDPYATADQYYGQALQIAEAGEEEPANADWLPLGVFAITGPGQTDSEKVLQLAINKDGIIRGDYYDKTTNEDLIVRGAVDRESQRAAWTIGDNRNLVYETGISNLSQDEAPVLLHYGGASTANLTLVRLQQPQEQ